jgi:hypothetical protein
MWKILGNMDWSLQRPAKQARERDPEKVKLWLEQRWPAVKKSSPAQSLDLLPGRKRRLATTLHPAHVGAERRNPDPDSCLQLEKNIHLCRHGIPLGWETHQVVVPDAGRQL